MSTTLPALTIGRVTIIAAVGFALGFCTAPKATSVAVDYGTRLREQCESGMKQLLSLNAEWGQPNDYRDAMQSCIARRLFGPDEPEAKSVENDQETVR